jgi:Flp pilus assembly protein TadG
MKLSRACTSQQNGMTTVEFAIVGLLLFVVLFAVIEFGRALFIMNTLTEATRRGARLAAVCPVGDPKPASAAVFDSGSGSSAVVSGLTTANILIEYLDVNGTAIASPGANFSQIHYVRATVVGFSVSLVIPTIMPTLPMTGFSTTLPRESLGIPRAGVVTAC